MTHIHLMTAVDVPLGMRLKQQNGWNQLEADWVRALELQPDGCFVAEADGTSVGTVTTCIFGPVAWIAMMLVDEALRGRGLGKALMSHALAFLDRKGVTSVRLDATPMGQPLYEKLGFGAEYELARYHGSLPPAPVVSGVSAARPERSNELLELDRSITATDRRKFLLRLFAEAPEELRVVERDEVVHGFLTVRRGARALLIGPCLARADAGALLLRDAWHRYAGQYVFIDIPDINTDAVALAKAQGLTVQRPLVRMCRGPKIEENPQYIWASSGPEKG